MRFLTPAIPAAGYFTLTNNGSNELALTSASSPDCHSLMLHRSVTQNGTAHMEMVQRIPLHPHDSVTFEPGGYHLMCMAPSAAVTPGRSVPVTLHFDGGASLMATFPVYGAKGK